MIRPYVIAVPVLVLAVLSGCSMTEEVKRIEQVRRAQMASQASRSTDLTGEEIFIRSCNTCHPSGRQNVGPRLDMIDEHYPTDEGLKALIRNGKGMMPPQPKDYLNDKELDNLVRYLRDLTKQLKESSK